VRHVNVRIDRVIVDSRDCAPARASAAAEALAAEIRRALAPPGSADDVAAVVERAVRRTFDPARARP